MNQNDADGPCALEASGVLASQIVIAHTLGKHLPDRVCTLHKKEEVPNGHLSTMTSLGEKCETKLS